jgi:hypothetical protein
MAARQDQTLQIFLIIFIFLFLITAVVAYLGWRGYSDASQNLAKTQSDLSAANQTMSAKKTELEDLQEKVGFGRETGAAEVKAGAEADMKTYGSGIADEASRTYRKVLETVWADSQRAAAREATLTTTLKEREQSLLNVQTQAQKKVDEYDTARKKAETDRATEASKFSEDRKALETTKAALQKSLDDQRTKYEATIADRDKVVKDLTDKNAKLEHAVANLIENRKDEPESFEVADGRISYVNQNGTVWINLGTGDSLRRQVTFSVFDSDLHDASKSKKKGSIEVTRVLGDHMAEARITSDDPTNPVLTGDKIYSQIWHRGKKLHFALTGLVDFDGDGKSDLELARELIELNGGVVDAYLGDDGKIQGEITANTRYLVSGDSPESSSRVALQAGTNDMYKTASSLGVETITLPEFLAQMGYRPQDRTVQLGADAKASDFPARPERDGSGLGPSRFRARPTTTPEAATATDR